MQIGIIGLGLVGSAIRYGFEKLGHTISFHDIKYETSIKDVTKSNVCFLCVPTPSLDNGQCDVSIVENTVSHLNDLDYDGVVAIKSTVEPGTTKRLKEMYPKLKICFVP